MLAVNVAVPVESSVAVPSRSVPVLKVTVPRGTDVVPAALVATTVSVTLAPDATEVELAVSLVVVATFLFVTVMVAYPVSMPPQVTAAIHVPAEDGVKVSVPFGATLPCDAPFNHEEHCCMVVLTALATVQSRVTDWPARTL